MTVQEAIRYSCRIKALVWRSIDPEANTASDCMCDDRRRTPTTFRDEGLALDWILEAVHLRLINEHYKIDEASLNEVFEYRGKEMK